jgi:hypothetical protein
VGIEFKAIANDFAIRFLAKRGATAMRVISTSLVTTQGLARSSPTLPTPSSMEELRIEPSWQVTAVHGKDPKAVEKRMSDEGTEARPHARLSADQGMTPTRRRMVRRTQDEFDQALSSESEAIADSSSVGLPRVGLRGIGEVLGVEVPVSAFRVNVSAFGKKRVRRGVRGFAKRADDKEPSAVRRVRRSVAGTEWKSAPARTFCKYKKLYLAFA